jgi:hypothetical protein
MDRVTINLIVVMALIVLVGLGCDPQPTEPEDRLEAPVLLSPPDDMAVDEAGLDAIPGRNAIGVVWRTAQERSRYQLYRRAEDEDRFSHLAEVQAPDTSYVDGQVALYKRYAYYVTHTSGARTSPPSDTLDYMLVEKAINLSVSLADSLLFYWQIQGTPPDRYIVKLFDDVTQEAIWISRVPSGYEGTDESVTFNWDGEAGLDPLRRDRRYRWRVDIVGPALNSGSESRYHYFVLPE